MIRRHSCKGVGSSVAWSLLGLAISAQSLAGTVTTDGADIVIKTKGGLEVATTDKEFSFKLGGRLQADYGRFDGYYTNNGNTADAAYFRRAYLEFGGTAYRDWKYQINYDLSRNVGNDSAGYFDEASVTYTGFNPVNLKFGRFYTDFGLEKATSSKWHDLAKVGVASSSLVSRSKHDPGFGLGRREKGLRALFSFLRSAPPWCFSRFPPCSPRQAAVPPHLLARSSRRKRPLVEWPSLVERRRRSGQRFEHRQQAGEVVGHAQLADLLGGAAGGAGIQTVDLHHAHVGSG